MMLGISSLLVSSIVIFLHSPSAGATVLRRQSGGNCTSPSLRQEWSSVSQDVRDNYISAAICLTTKPSRIGLNTTLYDDFAHVHNALNHEIHFVAQFLPWHRYFVHVYEQSLKECGYTGNALYWDWTIDSQNPPQAAIWDPTTGIGGNGDRSIPDTQPRCIMDGPFQHLRPAYKAGDYEPHCLARNWNNGTDQIGDMLGPEYSPSAIAKINQAQDYPTFHTQLENGPHGAVHSGIGGDMMPATSPNDPVFFLHHTQIDRLWWLWQSVDSNRTYMFGGNKNQLSPDAPSSPPAELTDLLPMLGMAADIPIIDVMSTETDLLCYTY